MQEYCIVRYIVICTFLEDTCDQETGQTRSSGFAVICLRKTRGSLFRAHIATFEFFVTGFEGSSAYFAVPTNSHFLLYTLLQKQKLFFSSSLLSSCSL